MLNEAPNNNDVMHVANTVLNEVPNNEDATQHSQKCAFNYHGHTTMLNGSYIAVMQKSQLTRETLALCRTEEVALSATQVMIQHNSTLMSHLKRIQNFIT